MTISFDSGRHEAFLAQLQAATTEIQEVLDALDGEVTGLRRQWSGAAQSAYDAAQAAWLGSMVTLRGMLGETRRGAEEAGERLRAAENGVRSLWTG